MHKRSVLILFLFFAFVFTRAQDTPAISIVNVADTGKKEVPVSPISIVNTADTAKVNSETQPSPVSNIKTADTIQKLDPTAVTQPAAGAAQSVTKADSSSNVSKRPPYVSPNFVLPENYVREPERSFIVGLGAGMLLFRGDVNSDRFKMGYHLYISKKIAPYLTTNFYTMFGGLESNEQNNPRNANFMSQIKVFGFDFSYSFEHFINPSKFRVRPFVTLGVEALEFVTKTDLYDQYGNKYYYWSDGSIRSKDESANDAFTSVVLKRDYVYETDVRQQNADGFNKYPELTFAIPIGAGIQVDLFEGATAKLGVSYHYTFSDYLDGITEKSTGNRAGNNANDKFIYSYFSVQYNFIKRKKDLDTLGETYFNDVDYLAFDKEDLDYDGVPDMQDTCQGTPWGVKVDASGCPPDDDGDGVPNYRDQELATVKGLNVTEFGVGLTDSIIKLLYLTRIDSTGEYHRPPGYVPNYKSTLIAASTGDDSGLERADGSYIPKEYTIELGAFKNGVPPNIMSKFLSIPDIKSTILEDSTAVYTVGSYENYEDANTRKGTYVKEGFANARVVYKKDGKYIEAKGTEGKALAGRSNVGAENVNTTDEPGLLRVQLGAYKNRMSKTVFKNVSDLFEIRTPDGLYKYASGAFRNMKDAANRKADLVAKGFSGAFITAYNKGERVSLVSMGATPLNPKKKEDLSEPTKTVSSVNKKLVVFKVQVGVYKGEPPADRKALLAKIKEVKSEMTPTGLTRFSVGEFNDYKAAEKLKKQLTAKGVNDAFIIAFFNGQYITVQEALELVK